MKEIENYIAGILAGLNIPRDTSQTFINLCCGDDNEAEATAAAIAKHSGRGSRVFSVDNAKELTTNEYERDGSQFKFVQADASEPKRLAKLFGLHKANIVLLRHPYLGEKYIIPLIRMLIHTIPYFLKDGGKAYVSLFVPEETQSITSVYSSLNTWLPQISESLAIRQMNFKMPEAHHPQQFEPVYDALRSFGKKSRDSIILEISVKPLTPLLLRALEAIAQGVTLSVMVGVYGGITVIEEQLRRAQQIMGKGQGNHPHRLFTNGRLLVLDDTEGKLRTSVNSSDTFFIKQEPLVVSENDECGHFTVTSPAAK